MRPRLLILDDDGDTLVSIRAFLAGQGYEVDCAGELEEAEALLAHFAYALVVADLRLSGGWGVEGLDLARFVQDRCDGTRVLLLTAHASSEVETEARRRGAVGLLRKPIALTALASTIAALLGSP
jgi:DNA-binding response OmpR family regulator